MTIHRDKDALQFLSGHICGGETNIVCPSCSSDYTHVHHVGTLVGSDQFEAATAYEGTATSGSTPERRSAVEIVFECEGCPQRFSLVIQQHKGNNFVEIHENIPQQSG